ncbi:MAG: hypothetical protein M1363_04625 [Gammaproteobacteria bacterium]|nr:hypothetical protein [Gammaproteobacteria bacterium]
MSQASSTTEKPIRHSSFPWGVVILYVFIGPIIGNAVLAIVSTLTIFFSDLAALLDAISSGMVVFMFGLMLCHLMGGIQALLCGIAAAFWQRQRGQLPYAIAALFGAIVGLGFILTLGSDGFFMSILFVAVHILAVIGCNYLARKF